LIRAAASTPPFAGFFTSMADASTRYRAFPETIINPSFARRFSAEEFASLQKVKLQDAPSACARHAGTTIWYVEQMGYIVEIHFDSRDPVYIHSICTFTPTMGMDKIDGEFAQDAEEYILHESLGFPTELLAVYGDLPAVPIADYLRRRGIIR
jgi:hypothetical protein